MKYLPVMTFKTAIQTLDANLFHIETLLTSTCMYIKQRQELSTLKLLNHLRITLRQASFGDGLHL